MSANNFIQIDRKDFTVSHCDADTGFGIKIGQAETLNGAIYLAQKYQEENAVEHGIQFTVAGEDRRKKEDKLKKQAKNQP